MKNTKQVIVIRKDLNMRKGKIAAQASHASMAFLTKGMRASYSDDYSITLSVFETKHYTPEHFEEITHWLKNSFRKICVYVNSEEELRELHQRVLDKGLISHIVEDNGLTEFNGVLTKTCIAIGPHYDECFEGITDHLPLL
jgi:PTH2 family peptidyl-tRNA hydrolase